MNKDLSHVPCVGSELTHPIDDRLYGQPDDHGAPAPRFPDGSHEVCGTESFRLLSTAEWLAGLVHAQGRR
jgi:hypothetical protein